MKLQKIFDELSKSGWNVELTPYCVKVNIGFMAKDFKESDCATEYAYFTDLKFKVMDWCLIHAVPCSRVRGWIEIYSNEKKGSVNYYGKIDF